MAFSIIFDLDGNITDNAAFLKQTWGEFCKIYHINFWDEIFDTVFSGKTNNHIITDFKNISLNFNRQKFNNRYL